MAKIWYCGISKEDYKRCTPLIEKDTFGMARTMSYGGTIIMAILFVASLFWPELEKFKFIYLGFMLGFLAFSLLMFFLKFRPKIAMPLMYAVCTLYYAFGILLTVQFPGQKSTIIQVEFILLPVLFTDKPLRLSLFILTALGAFIGTELAFQTPDLLFAECFNGTCLSLLSIVTNWLVDRSRCKGYLAKVEEDKTVEELQKAQVQLRIAAEIDALTGLGNRRKLFNRIDALDKEIEKTVSGIFMVDIDRFKDVNDSLGHLMGDRFLTSFGEMMLKMEKEDGFESYRYGGEEFIVICFSKNEEELKSLAEKIRQGTNRIDIGIDYRITASIGLTDAQLEAVPDYERWIDHADKAVYRAKATGRNKVCVWKKTK